MSTYGISTFESATNPTHTRRDVSWAAVLATMARPLVRPVQDGEDLERVKRGLPAWSPATFRTGLPRSLSACEAVSLLVLDYDMPGLCFDLEISMWWEYRGCAHTSWSHTEAHHRFRVVIPLAKPIPARWWKRVFHWVLARGEPVDTVCKDPSRIFFKPAVRSPDWPWRFESWDGPVLDLVPEQLAPAAEERPPRPVERQPTYRTCSPAAAARERQRRLSSEPWYREEAATLLGARLTGTGTSRRARGVVCPACSRPDAWFWIDPERATHAACGHKNSCGWSGPLWDLPGVAA